MMLDQVKSLCHQMQLAGMLDAVDRRSTEAVSGQLHPLDFLRLLLEDELLKRREIRGKTLANKAKFRTIAALEDWDMSFDRGLSKAKIKELTQLCFFYNRESLVLVGGTGSGKTHLAVAVGRRACAEGVSTAFLPMNFLFEEALAQKAVGKYISYIRKLAKTGVVVLDDFGLRNYTHEEASVLVDVLEERYQKGSVIVTSQVSPEGWIKLFEDPVIGEAIVDRLQFPSQKIHIKGPSYRDRLQSKFRG